MNASAEETGKQFLVDRIIGQAEREGTPLAANDLHALQETGARALIPDVHVDALEELWCGLLNRAYAFERTGQSKRAQRDIQRQYRYALCDLADEDRWLWQMLVQGTEASRTGQVKDAALLLGCALVVIVVLSAVSLAIILLWEKLH